jgi:prefoldin subunit 5
MEDIRQHVDRLEWRVDAHDEQLSALTAQAEGLRGMLDSINRTLMQIKWLVVGGAVVYFAQELGFSQFIKVMGVI